MTNIRAKGIEKHYREHRLLHPDAAPWDKVVHYAMNGNEFGKRLRIDEWVLLTKASKNTIVKWLPLIKDYIASNSILNVDAADAIVATNITKQNKKGST